MPDQIRHLASSHYEPLTKLCGVNLLTAGILAGMLGPGRRFETEAQLAAYAGTSPLEASSAGVVRHRLNRGGNRRLNSVIYRIALTQAHFLPEARAYIERRVSEARLAGRLIAVSGVTSSERSGVSGGSAHKRRATKKRGSRVKAIAHRSVR